MRADSLGTTDGSAERGLCAQCGATFIHARRPGARAKFCGDECRRQDASLRAKKRYAAVRGNPETKRRMARASRASYERKLADPGAMEVQREQTRAWREKSADHLAAYGRRYRQEKSLQITEKNRRRRARLMSAWDEDVDLIALLDAHAGMCGICGERIDREVAWPDKRSLTLDHIVPLARGGRHRSSNCQPAHAVCNSRKNDRLN